MSFACRAIGAVTLASALACSHAYAADAVTRVTNLGDLSLPTALVFSHVFSTPLPFTLTSADRFYDDYAFSVPASSYSSLVSSIDLADTFSIQGLTATLYQGSLSTTVAGPVGAGLLPVGLTGRVPIATSGPGAFDPIGPMSLASGTYIFEVVGRVVGASGGAYTGILNVASPVPEPGALGLLLAGLGVLGMARRRRNRR